MDKVLIGMYKNKECAVCGEKKGTMVGFKVGESTIYLCSSCVDTTVIKLRRLGIVDN